MSHESRTVSRPPSEYNEPMPIERDSDQTKVAVVDHYSGKVLDNRYKVEFQLASGGFGDTQKVCGPGDAKGATDVGVTDTSMTTSSSPR